MKTLLAFLLLASALIAWPPGADSGWPHTAAGGGTPSVEFVTSATTGSTRSDTQSNVGYAITVGAAPITVTDLGRRMISGNTGSHTIHIYNSGGTAVATAVVNMTGGTVGAGVYTSITPVTLSASATYNVCSSEGGDTWYDNVGTTLTHTADATVLGTATSTTGHGSTADNAYGFPLFKYHL